MSSKPKKPSGKPATRPNVTKGKRTDVKSEKSTSDQPKAVGSKAAPGLKELKELTAALNRCKDVVKVGKHAVDVSKRGEKHLANNLDRVTADMHTILDDLRRHVGRMEVDGKLSWPEEKIEVVTRQFFSDKLLTNGRAKRMASGGVQSAPTSPVGARDRKSRSSDLEEGSSMVSSGTRLTRGRRLSPSGNARREGNGSVSPPSRAGSRSRSPKASSSSVQSANQEANRPKKAKKSPSGTKAGSKSSIPEKGKVSVASKQSITSQDSIASSKKGSNVSVKSEPSKKKVASNESLHKPVTSYLRRAISDINPLSAIKSDVQKAIRDKKTFTIRGNYPAIRRALVARGWLEKLNFEQTNRGGPGGNSELRRYRGHTVEELAPLLRVENQRDMARRLIVSRLLEGTQVDFCWSFSGRVFRDYSDKVKLTLISRFRKDVFDYTTKQGLCEVANNSYWYQIPGVSQINHPRSYSLTRDGDTRGFVRDFGVTAAMSLLKWVVHAHATGESKVVSRAGRIPLETFDFAVNECGRFLQRAQHRDIDEEVGEATEHEWHRFLEYFYRLVHVGNHFRQQTDGGGEEELAARAEYVVGRLRDHWPYVDTDGMLNVWILKPTLGCRGQGIHICRTLHYVLNTIRAHPNVRYVIQKYIERPLLIFNTKFDIRQWFLISQASPLTIWIYKECYLRFSSQTYNLRKLHESIHLTNNAVQARYANSTGHDRNLPPYNMWTLQQFLAHLAAIGYPRAYHERVRPGMRQSIAAAVLTHQGRMDRRLNSFELYGADFILAEDFTPWLLEINSSPALYASTPVTAKMCPEVLEDVIKGIQTPT